MAEEIASLQFYAFLRDAWKHKKSNRVKHACDYHKRTHTKCNPACPRLHSRIKKCRQPLLITDLQTGKVHQEYRVHRIVTHRIIRNQVQYYVKWLGYDQSSNTWEPLEMFQKSDGSLTEQLCDYVKTLSTV